MPQTSQIFRPLVVGLSLMLFLFSLTGCGRVMTDSDLRQRAASMMAQPEVPYQTESTPVAVRYAQAPRVQAPRVQAPQVQASRQATAQEYRGDVGIMASTAYSPGQSVAYETAPPAYISAQEAQQRLEAYLPSAPESVQAIYAMFGNQPLWYRGSWSGEAMTAAEMMNNTWGDGLPPYRYGLSEHQPVQLGAATSADAIIQTELAMTQTMLSYLPDVRDGLGQPVREDASLLVSALTSGNFDSFVETLRPQSRQFQGLRQAMRTLPMDTGVRRTVALNMHRFRHQSEHEQLEASRRLRVNLPSFELWALDGGRPEMTMAVIIGQDSRPTPIIKDKIVNLKFSPDWSLPSVSASEDILPLLQADARKLVNSMHLQVFRGGKKIDPLSVDWNRYSASNLPFTFRQPPGPRNALGGVRFSMTNPQMIFLHDTPERDMFQNNVRMLSSGCVRVQRAEELAKWIMAGDKGMSMNEVQVAMYSGETRLQPLKQALPVDLTYYTAEINAAGEVKVYGDIYGKDLALSQSLGL